MKIKLMEIMKLISMIIMYMAILTIMRVTKKIKTKKILPIKKENKIIEVKIKFLSKIIIKELKTIQIILVL